MRRSIYAVQDYADGWPAHIRYEVAADAPSAMLRFLARDPEIEPNRLRVVWYCYHDHPGIPA